MKLSQNNEPQKENVELEVGLPKSDKRQKLIFFATTESASTVSGLNDNCPQVPVGNGVCSSPSDRNVYRCIMYSVLFTFSVVISERIMDRGATRTPGVEV